MAVYDSTFKASSNYEEQGGAIWVIGGQLIFDTTTAVKFTVTGANIIVTGLPTSDPTVAGALYSNSGVLTLSAG